MTKRISAIDINLFLKQFTTLISANIPIIQSCDILANCQEKHVMRTLINQIKYKMVSGKSLFDSFNFYPQHFNELTCRLIQLGEQTGKLETTLSLIVNYHDKTQMLKRNITQALFYPCIIIIIALMITTCMFLFVIPHFAELFQNTQIELPLLTVCIFSLSTFLHRYLWVIFTMAGMGLLLFIFNSRKKSYRPHQLKQVFHFFPPLKKIADKIVLAHFSRHLAITIAAGMPVTNALLLTSNASVNTEFIQLIAQVTKNIRAGFTLYQAMSQHAFFPTLMTQMIKIGEEVGLLEEMMNKFADFIEADINQLIQRLTQLLEPLIMMLLGVLIGGLVISMYLPLFKLGNTF